MSVASHAAEVQEVIQSLCFHTAEHLSPSAPPLMVRSESGSKKFHVSGDYATVHPQSLNVWSQAASSPVHFRSIHVQLRPVMSSLQTLWTAFHLASVFSSTRVDSLPSQKALASS